MAVPTMSRRCWTLFFLLAACLAAVSGKQYDWQWRTGRATYYGTDAWSIHKGSCNYGYIWRDEPHGWDVAAMTDYHPDYENSCGTCYEVKCNQAWVQDNYGQSMDRTYTCYDTSQSILIRVTDTCPCTYPANWYSNKRWCCNDVDHFDVSAWAFEKLADKKWGVIAIQYRRVPCTYTPDKPAPVPSNPSPNFGGEPWSQNRPVRDWPEYAGDRDPLYIFLDKVADGWWIEGQSGANKVPWVQPFGDSAQSGMRKGTGLCVSLQPSQQLRLKTWSSSQPFAGKYKLQFWLYVGVTGWEGTGARVPDININIGGDKGGCQIRRIYDVKPDAFEPMCQYCADYYWRWEYYLPFFAGWDTNQDFKDSSQFGGCGNNGVSDLNYIEFRNDKWDTKWICFDRIALW